MSPLKSGAAAFLCAAFALGGAPTGAAQERAGGGFMVYTEDVPCPPRAAVKRAHVVRRVRKRRSHKIAVVRPRTVPHVTHIRKRIRPRPARLVRAAAPAASPRRCTVVRRDPLTAASFGYDAVAPILEPVVYAVEPGGPAVAVPAQAGGDPAIGDPPGGGAGGGGSGGGVSPAPEPDAWLLMGVGVGLCGLVLRRRRRDSLIEAHA